MDKKQQKKVLDLFEQIKKELQIEPKPETTDENVELSPIEQLELEFAALLDDNAKLAEAKLMAVADNQNTVKLFQKEAILVRKYGGEKLASEMLPAIDMFKSVFNSLEDKPEIKNYLMGFEMVVNQIDQALSNSGVTQITTNIGDELNPEIHYAIEQIETDQVKPGQIAVVVSNGYKLYDRVIKHVIVKVAK
ncbi:molecular chaperone GrpE (heat shock protein) [Spiroplasma clarkii]|uniref:Protein GrpE n=1 Tax=Spiroplasma clarkii TaxID=2139 RepID=A0A1Y0L1W1_9MOLU|nr:nucleotide exchange factor GrpE [Spiroplasma clarkii]ARU91963.1 molecular chaperone GrpE (heat shock protein) [Spiroplasma clarkii]ATX71303.1 molecular chaperone GrpE (heat shock protein) [Spiroplasma clarkii]